MKGSAIILCRHSSLLPSHALPLWSVSFSFPFHKAETASAHVWVASPLIQAWVLLLVRGRWRVEGSAVGAGQTQKLLRWSMVAAVTGRITEAVVVDQAVAIPMMVLSWAWILPRTVTVQVAAAIAVVTTKEVALVVGNQGGNDGSHGRMYYQGGRKSLYTIGELPFNTNEFEITFPDYKRGPSRQWLTQLVSHFAPWHDKMRWSDSPCHVCLHAGKEVQGDHQAHHPGQPTVIADAHGRDLHGHTGASTARARHCVVWLRAQRTE